MMRNFSFLKIPVILTILLSAAFSSCSGDREKSLEYVDTGIDLYYRSQFKEALEYFKKALDEDKNSYEALFWIGNYYNNQRKYKKAIEYYTRAIEINPGFADAYANRGFAKENLKDKKGACRDWKRAQQLGKSNLDNHLQWCK
jgi:tetratricopeptide (TPR) repeat protein